MQIIYFALQTSLGLQGQMNYHQPQFKRPDKNSLRNKKMVYTIN